MANKKYSQKAVKISEANFQYITEGCKELSDIHFQSFNTVLTAILESHDKHAYTRFLVGLKQGIEE